MIKLLIGLLIIACILPLFIKGPDGKPIMTLDDWKLEVPTSLSGLADDAMQELGPEVGQEVKEPATVYKWQDEKGQWHFSNQPPDVPEGAEEMELTGDINIMDAYVPPEPEPTTTTTAAANVPGITGPMTVAPEQVKEMMETVTNLQQTVDDRKKELDQMTGN